jgi:hypothetical protein
MKAILPVLIGAGILALLLVTALVIVIAGIHGDERNKSLTREPRALSGVVARWVLGAHSDHEPRSGVTRAETRR